MNVFESDSTSQLAFAIHENPGVYALLLGSGLSRSAVIPTGWEITLDLIRRVGALKGVKDSENWESWYLRKFKASPDYSDLVASVASTAAERRSILDSYIEPTETEEQDGLKQPTSAHKAIASLVKYGHVKVILTTNFDRLIENALRIEGIEPTVVSSADQLSGAEPLAHSDCFVFKLHGDYKDARILNTSAELAKYPKSYSTLLNRIFDEYGLIAAGWSGQWDGALRAATLKAPGRRYSTYWATRGSIKVEAADLASHRKAINIEISSADEFFMDLQRRIEILEHSRKPQPQSLALLTNSVKRYLARPEFRIELSDLIEDQLQQILESTSVEHFSVHGTWSDEEFQNRVNAYEDLTEPLARCLGLLGRFGDDTEYSLAMDVIRSVYETNIESQSGLTAWLNIRTYPSVLLFYAYGIGLLKSKRFAALHRLFNEKLLDRTGEREKRTVEMLFLWDWRGYDQDIWRRYSPEYAKRHTPLSDRLCEITGEWKSDIVGQTSDYEFIFEEFEMLASLTHFLGNSRAEIEAAFSPLDEEKVRYFRVPFGRIAWDKRREALERRLADPDYVASLLKAGFALSQEDTIEFFLIKLQYQSRRLW